MSLDDLALRWSMGEAALRERLRLELTQTGVEAEGKAKDLMRARLRVRSGLLMRSVRYGLSEEGGALTLRLRAGDERDVRYARLQEEGGTVVPRGRYLAVPAEAAQTASGVSRGGPRDYPDLRFIPLRGGRARAMLAQVTGKGKARRLRPFFWLVERITIRGKYPIRDAWRDALASLERRVDAAAADVLGGA